MLISHLARFIQQALQILLLKLRLFLRNFNYSACLSFRHGAFFTHNNSKNTLKSYG